MGVKEMEFSLIESALRTALIIVIAFLLTAGTVMVVKLSNIDMKDFHQRTGTKIMVIALMANLLFIFAVYVMMTLMDHHSFLTLGFFFTPKDIIFSMLSLLLTVFLGIIFGIGFIKNQYHWTVNSFIKQNEVASFLLSFLVLFIAALQEEIMFRGYLSHLFLGLGFLTAGIVSSFLFTIWHFIGNKVNPYQSIDWLLGGLLLFFVYVEAHSIWTAAIIHFSRNLTNVLIFNIAGKHSLLHWDVPISPKQKTLFTAACSSVLALFTFLVYK